jgi:hypothetical protein
MPVRSCLSLARHAPAALILWSLACASSVQATQVAAPQAPRKAPSTSVKFIDAPSGESPASREKRLRRECRGRPNAGLCLGHTR